MRNDEMRNDEMRKDDLKKKLSLSLSQKNTKNFSPEISLPETSQLFIIIIYINFIIITIFIRTIA